jgi:hypothetical protein
MITIFVCTLFVVFVRDLIEIGPYKGMYEQNFLARKQEIEIFIPHTLTLPPGKERQ